MSNTTVSGASGNPGGDISVEDLAEHVQILAESITELKSKVAEKDERIADLFDKDRTDLLVDAIRKYIEETAKSETFQELVATKYYDAQLEFETVKQLVGAETAQRLRLLKADLEGEPFDLATPDDTDIYDSNAKTVESEHTPNDADER